MSETEVLEDVLDEDRLKYCFECGICTSTCPIVELLPEDYNPRSLMQRALDDLDGVLRDKSIWLCAWCYRCHDRCPQELRVPEILLRLKETAAERGEYEGLAEALDLLVEKVPLPLANLFTCFQPERGEVEKPEAGKMVRKLMAQYLERTKGENEGVQPLGHKIAIVGSGPAGLTAAFQLAKLGYQVTVFEALSKPGGMLGWCIPAYRLPRKAVRAEIKRIENLGVVFETGIRVGKDKTLDDILEEGYEAIFIAIGAHRSRRLGIPGEEMGGVLDALEFLKQASLGKKIDIGKKVVVVGGGDVAMDAARIARIAVHLGAENVTIIYRRSREEMPANPWEVRETEEDGVEIQFLIAPQRIIGEEGRVKGVECIKMKLGKPDDSGRPRPMPVAGSEFTIEADTVIPAIGESPELFTLPEGVRVSRRRTIVVDPFDLQTGDPRIFAGGDVVRGPSTVIEAIIDGKRAARAIDEYVREQEK